MYVKLSKLKNIFLALFIIGSYCMLKAQTYLKFEQITGIVSSSVSIVAVSQSSGTAATIVQMNDMVFTTGALTTSSINAWVRVDMDSARTISYVDLAAQSAVGNLNGRRIEVSTDGTSWITVLASITGASTTITNRYSFAPISARYVRVFNPAATAGIVGVSEFIPETISNLIVAPAGNDTRSTVRNFPFPITFKGITYSSFSVNSNGLMRLGNTLVSTTGVNVTRETVNNTKLYAYWDNIATGTLATQGGVRSWSEGTSPNRIFIIDWKTNNANSTSGVVNMNFQIRMSETTGVIEYVYGAGITVATNTATIGMATSVTDFISVTALGSPAIISYHNFNDAITNVWPGNGVVYRFTPTNYPSTTLIPVTDFVSLENAIGALNWAGVSPAGGTVINVSGLHTEIVPNAITVAPAVPAGLLLTATGTATNPIVFNGNGAIIRAGLGNFNWDYVFGLAGSDYVSINNFNIRDNNANSTNLARAEIGIGLFKKLYNTTLGNDGCQFVTISNNNIELTRLPTAVRFSTIWNGISNVPFGTSEVYYSRGIFVNRWNNTHTGLQGVNTNPNHSRNNTLGIRSKADVHSNNTIIGNTINDCSLGIEIDDHYLLSGAYLFAGENNIIGTIGAGNNITNWGPTGTNIYTTASYDNGGTHFAGISAAGQKNFTIEHNVIGAVTSETSISSDVENYIGINVGRNHIYQATPMRGNTNFFIKINHNVIQGINATVGLNNKTAQGIVLWNGYLAGNTNSSAYAVNGPIEINNNNITNLRTINGKVAGIGTFVKTSHSREPSIITSPDNMFNYWFTNGTACIKNNTITNIVKTPTLVATVNYGLTSAIQWNIPVNELLVDSNVIGGSGINEIKIETPNFINAHSIGLRSILIDMNGTNFTNRTNLIISNNNISNVNRLVTGSITSHSSQNAQGASAIYLGKGAVTNTIHNNTINGMTVANGLYLAAINQSVEVIKVLGIPRSGVSNVHITNNQINNITRNHFGFLTSMATGSGLNSFTAVIAADYASVVQVKNISGNIISSVNQTNNYTTTEAQQALYYSQLNGIRVRGRNAIGNNIRIANNLISNLAGANWNNVGVVSSTNINQFTTAWNVVGINAADYHILEINNNEICGLSTTHSGGTLATNINAFGIVGINFGKINTGASATNSILGELVYNNFIGDMTAPNMNSTLAVQGIYYWGFGRFARIIHNTIVLGNPDGLSSGRLSTTSSNSYGISGVTFNNASWNDKRYQSFFSNNIISINAEAKGSTTNTLLSTTTTGGFVTAWRHFSQSSIRRAPLGISPNSGGNIYFVNEGFRNFIYAQGQRYWTSTNGIRNAFGYWYTSAPANYASQSIHTTRHIKNDVNSPNNFNEICGYYKSYWGIFQRGSFIDLDLVTNEMVPLPFKNSGSMCSIKYQIIDSASTFIGSSEKYSDALFDLSFDFFGRARGGEVLSGAYEDTTNSVDGSPVSFIKFEYTPICDAVCVENKQILVKLLPPLGKSIDTTWGASAPRIYYRRVMNSNTVSAAQSDANVMVNDLNNSASGISGWRWVEAISCSGNEFAFEIDESKLRSALVSTPTYSVEYFIIAQSSDLMVTSWSTGDFSDVSCPANVDLFSVGGATQVPADSDGPTSLEENSVFDIYSVYAGSSITKRLEVLNNQTIYTANNTTPISVCLSDSLIVVAHFAITASGETFDNQCVVYKYEFADNTAFTANLQTFTSVDSIFKYEVLNTTNKFVRISLDCGGTTPANMNSVYATFVGIVCPSLTSNITFLEPCEGTNMSLTATRNAGVGSGFLFLDPYGKAYPSLSTATSVTNNVVGPVDSSQNGVWKVIGINQQLALGSKVQGIAHGSLSTIAGEESGEVTTGKGLVFDVSDPVKINSVVIKDAGSDGLSTVNFNVQIVDSNGRVLFNHIGPAVAENAISTLTFSNCFIPPGNNYMMVLTNKLDDSDPSGELVTTSGSFPYVVTNGALTIKGGIENLDFNNYSSSYNYFFSWNLTLYCMSSNEDTFHVRIKEIPRVQSDMIDTLNVCIGDTIMIAPLSTSGENLLYQWQKLSGSTWSNLAGKTDSVLLFPNSLLSDAGNYRLLLTGSCGNPFISDTVNVIVNAKPVKPIVNDLDVCGANVNNIILISTEENTHWYKHLNKNNLLSVGSQIILPPLSFNDTLFAFNYDEITGCFSIPDTASVHFVNLYDIPTSVGEFKADAVCIDNFGWSHYYNVADKKLILSMELDPSLLGVNLITNGWNTSSSDFEVIAGVEANRKFLQQGNPSYVQNVNGWYVMRRYWKVNTNELNYISNTADVSVKMYYKMSDYSDLNANPVTMGSINEMKFYKLPHGFDPASSNHANAASIDTFIVSSIPNGSLSTFYTDSFTANDKVYSAAFHVTGFSGGGGGAGGSCIGCTILPVTLAGFEVICENNNVNLQWLTVSEYNISHFEVEKSINGADWNSIGLVSASGNSSSSLYYTFSDNLISQNTFFLYRLKLVDMDGAFEYSHIAVSKCSYNKPNLIIAYPNPIENELFVYSSNVFLGNIEVFDIAGKLMFSENAERFKGVIITKDWAPGVYFLKTEGKVFKVIK